jgi:hypothetical protein
MDQNDEVRYQEDREKLRLLAAFIVLSSILVVIAIIAWIGIIAY